MVYLVFFTIPAAGLHHVVVPIADVLYLVFRGDVGIITPTVEFVLPVLLGNTVGGVILVAVVNYGQTSDRTTGKAEERPKLPIRAWLFGHPSQPERTPASSSGGEVPAGPDERLAALHTHLEATGELPVGRTADRWIGEATTISAGLIDADTPDDVRRERVGRVRELLEKVETTEHPGADEHVEEAKRLANEILD